MIKNLPVRYPELGRIRLGEKGKKGEPVKLETFRFTSPDDFSVKAVSAVFGGEVEPWTDEKAGIDDQWQVVTEAKAIEVLIPPDPLDISYERWGSGGRLRRCDSETCLIALRTAATDGAHFEEQPCFCAMKGLVPGDSDDVKKGGCDLVVRLKVVIPSLPGLGVWMLTSGSIYAAMELPGQLALLGQLREQGALVPADLCIDQRTEKKQWEKFKREYPVPVLRVRKSMTQLSEQTGQTGVAALGMGAPALSAGPDRESSRPSTIGDLPPTNQAVIYECSKVKVGDQEAHSICFAISKGRTSSRKDLTTAECAIFLAALADGSWQQLIVAGNQPTTVIESGPANTEEPTQPTLDEAASPADERMPDALRKAWNTFSTLPAELKAEGHKYLVEHDIPEDWRSLTEAQITQLGELVDALASEADYTERTSPARAPDEGEAWTAEQWTDAAKAAGTTGAKAIKQARVLAAELGVDLPSSLGEITNESLASRLRGWLDETRGAA